MSHILKNGAKRAVGKPYAAVQVEVYGKKLIVHDGSLCLVKGDTLVTELPSEFKVYGIDGEEIPPANKFYITVETINPYHLILDM